MAIETIERDPPALERPLWQASKDGGGEAAADLAAERRSVAVDQGVGSVHRKTFVATMADRTATR